MKFKKLTVLFLMSCFLFILSDEFIKDNASEVRAQTDKPKIVCYFSITEDWTKNMVGDTCEVVSLVTGSQDVHSYDPSADATLKMDGAALYVMLGIDIEAFAQDIANAYPNVPTVVLRVSTSEDPKNGVEPITDPVWTYPDGSHPTNEHFWMSPRYAIKFCRRLAEGIKTYIGPFEGSDYNNFVEQNLNIYVSKLSSELGILHGYRKTEPIKSMKVCEYHPAFMYFFQDLGVDRVAVIEQQEGNTVSAAHLQEVENVVNSSVIVIYNPQEESGKSLAEQVARDTDANITWLTPLIPVATPSEVVDRYGSQIDTYLEMLDFDIYQLEHSTVASPETISGYFVISIILPLMFAAIVIIFRFKKSTSKDT